MSPAKSPTPGKANGAAGAGVNGGPKVVRFFSVEGQRRRLEFAKLPPARAMTPEEETRYLGELQAQEEAAKKKAEAEEKARELAAREKAARSRAAAAGRGGRAADDLDGNRGQASERAAGSRTRSVRGRHAAEPVEEPAASGERRSGGRRADAGPGDPPSSGRSVTPASPSLSTDPAPRPATARPEARRGKVSRRGVIGAPQPRDDE